MAGRDEIIERAAVALDRIRSSRSARGLILYGLRGVGKTVLLNKISLDAESRGFAVVPIEAPEERSLPSLLAPALRATIFRLNRGEALLAAATKAMRALGSFVNSLKVKFDDIELSTEFGSERGLADSGDLERDLSDLLSQIAHASAERRTAVVLAIDEIQYLPEDQLAALIYAMHRISQHQLPITMIAAGLPQLVGRMGKAKSYAERLFEFTQIDRLDEQAARDALCKPAEREPVARR